MSRLIAPPASRLYSARQAAIAALVSGALWAVPAAAQVTGQMSREMTGTPSVDEPTLQTYFDQHDRATAVGTKKCAIAAADAAKEGQILVCARAALPRVPPSDPMPGDRVRGETRNGVAALSMRSGTCGTQGFRVCTGSVNAFAIAAVSLKLVRALVDPDSVESTPVDQKLFGLTIRTDPATPRPVGR